MHIEIQVALNFVISYLYNKLPRRRVNIFGEELEKALRDKFQGHWYPDKPYKGSAFRCLKTGDPIDSVFERAARESGVPISDIIENLPNELSVWVDPGEVSFRISEKGAVKILYSENSDNHEDSTSADREVNKTFNPEAQCFRPIDAVNTTMSNLSLSPKASPLAGSSPQSATCTSPTYKGSPNPTATTTANAAGNNSFMQRTQVPLTFTTATFAQTKFGSTKLKTSSKRANSAYRMSPTEFSNYIKQRAMQQQLHHATGVNQQPSIAPQPQSQQQQQHQQQPQQIQQQQQQSQQHSQQQPPQQSNHFGPVGPVSPARSLSPNPLSLGMNQAADSFYYPNMTMNIYSQYNGHRTLFDGHFQPDTTNGLYGGGNNGVTGKFSTYLEPTAYFANGNAINGSFGSISGPSLSPVPQIGRMPQQLDMSICGNLSAGATGVAATGVGTGTSVGGVGALTNLNSKLTNNKTDILVTVNGGNVADSSNEESPIGTPINTVGTINTNNANANNQQDSSNTKLIDGLNSFYTNSATGSPYQQLLVAN